MYALFQYKLVYKTNHSVFSLSCSPWLSCLCGRLLLSLRSPTSDGTLPHVPLGAGHKAGHLKTIVRCPYLRHHLLEALES
jgi:hypothetical protein